MLSVLGDLFNIRFESRLSREGRGLDAWILGSPDDADVESMLQSGRPSCSFVRPEQCVPCGSSASVVFSRHPAVPQVLAGRKVNSQDAISMLALAERYARMSVLASKAGAPVWAVEELDGIGHQAVAMQIPELEEGDYLYQHFCGRRFLHLLPLWSFLRSLDCGDRWMPPPLQSCFMFDDPNLHWPSYGFIDFERMGKHARDHGYHVSFATVPLDTWYVHKQTAELFKQFPEQLSLLVHGNDHSVKELARWKSDTERRNNLLTALRRINEFECKSGIGIARVMAPPHGACDERTLIVMESLGFEAACISSGSLHRYNCGAPWLHALGMWPSSLIGGIPVFPRFPFSGNIDNNVLLAVLLDQPIIAMGHHCDVRAGLGVLAEKADVVNSLGTVQWTDMTRISRSRFSRKIKDGTLTLRTFSNRIDVAIPEGIDSIAIEAPFRESIDTATIRWRARTRGVGWRSFVPDQQIDVQPGEIIEVMVDPVVMTGPKAQGIRKLRIWPVVRRQLTEARDRMSPVVSRIIH